MALLFADGFDHYQSADILKKWDYLYTGTTGGTTPVISPAYARAPGIQGMRVVGPSSGLLVLRKAVPSLATLVMGAAVYFESPANQILFRAEDAGTEQCSVRVDGTGHLIVSRNGTTLATSANVLASTTWYYIEWKVTIHNTTGQYEVRVNGTSTGWIPQSAANQNTRAQTNNYASGAAICGAVAQPYWVDDLYTANTTAPNGDFFGPCRVAALYPVGAGAHTDWLGNYASNFANVNERAADGDATFNQSATANQIDTYTFEDPPAGTILAIQHVIEARQDTGAQRTFCPIQRDGSNDREGTVFSLASTHLFYLDPKDVDPATSAAYTAANLAGYEFGYKLKS